ncbi:hypothetical protein SORBI_3003G388201 [Sorghum bicolor]|uniref:Uncharacterized protein n=1 Tax=Sorghum bicolor TaxID=4558 RepID=A0A1W0W0Y9_SORBI|nr:hypothetical protein SORBI_3003G388201 [Sorghum bicolor]
MILIACVVWKFCYFSSNKMYESGAHAGIFPHQICDILLIDSKFLTAFLETHLDGSRLLRSQVLTTEIKKSLKLCCKLYCASDYLPIDFNCACCGCLPDCCEFDNLYMNYYTLRDMNCIMVWKSASPAVPRNLAILS